MNTNQKTRRKPWKIPEILTEDEQARFLGELKIDTPAGTRNLCMIRLMLDAGLRSKEVINLRHKDIDLKTGCLMVRHGKGDKDRSLWLGEDLRDLLRDFIEAKPKALPRDLVFVSKAGRPLVTRYLRTLVNTLAEKAGIPKHIHCHTLRHSFATDLLRSTKNLVVVQKALGHADIQTTTIYTHIVDEELEEAMKGLRKIGGS